MRVYLEGKHIPMKDVTWNMLCSPKIYVDHTKDLNVKWSAIIRFEQRMAINKTKALLGIYQGYHGNKN